MYHFADDIPTQAEKLDARAFARGRMWLVSETGAEIMLSKDRAEHLDYEDWIAHHGGRESVRLHVIQPSLEKRETLLTEQECEAVDAFAAKQQLRSMLRWKYGPTPHRVPARDPERAWFVEQGALRARLFGLYPMPESDPCQW